MSDFMTISGAKIDLTDLRPIQLTEASKAQEYIQLLEPALIQEDGAPVYLVDDGETWTSSGAVRDAWNLIQEEGTFAGTPLMTIIERLFANGNSFRIWWADNDPNAFRRVEECHSIEETIETISGQVKRSEEIRVRHRNG